MNDPKYLCPSSEALIAISLPTHFIVYKTVWWLLACYSVFPVLQWDTLIISHVSYIEGILSMSVEFNSTTLPLLKHILLQSVKSFQACSLITVVWRYPKFPCLEAWVLVWWCGFNWTIKRWNLERRCWVIGGAAFGRECSSSAMRSPKSRLL